MGIYDSVKKRIDRISETLYFSLGKRLQRSAFTSPQNVITFLVMFTVLVVFSGGIIYISDPNIAEIFSTSGYSQSAGETFLFFFLNLLAFGGIYMMDRGIRRRRFDPTSFLIGLFLLFVVLVSTWYSICDLKMAGYC